MRTRVSGERYFLLRCYAAGIAATRDLFSSPPAPPAPRHVVCDRQARHSRWRAAHEIRPLFRIRRCFSRCYAIHFDIRVLMIAFFDGPTAKYAISMPTYHDARRPPMRAAFMPLLTTYARDYCSSRCVIIDCRTPRTPAMSRAYHRLRKFHLSSQTHDVIDIISLGPTPTRFL
jgi:hypothetical protein